MTNQEDKNEQKSERFNMFMSPSEMTAIDDWAWNNKIRSKSEAVRRLIQIGLFVEQELEQIIDIATDGVEIISQQNNELSEVYRLVINKETFGMMFDREQLRDIFSLAKDHADAAEDGARALQEQLVTIYNAIAAMVDAKSFRDGQAKSQDVIEKANAATELSIAQKAERDAMHDESRYIAIHTTTASADEKTAYEALPDDEKDAYLQVIIDKLKEEETSDPEAFAKRYGIDSRKFWEKSNWLELLQTRKIDMQVDNQK